MLLIPFEVVRPSTSFPLEKVNMSASDLMAKLRKVWIFLMAWMAKHSGKNTVAWLHWELDEASPNIRSQCDKQILE